jgi:hypothetical protein
MLILFSLMVFTCIRSEDPVQGVASSATAPRPRRQQLPAARFYGPNSMRRRRLSSEQRLSDQGTSSVSELIRPVWASRRVHKINERSVWKGFHEPTRNPGKIRPSYGISSASGLVDRRIARLHTALLMSTWTRVTRVNKSPHDQVRDIQSNYIDKIH